MQKKELLIVTNSGVGLYSFRFELVRELINQNYNVTLAYPKGEHKDDFERIGCHYIELPFDSSSTNPYGDILLFRRLRRMICQNKPDAALLYTIKPCIYAGLVMRKKGIPYICTVTGVSPALISDKHLVRTVTKHLSRVGYNGASTVFFQNSMNEKLYTKLKIANGRHKLIAGSGVNLKKFSYIDYPKEDGWIKLLYVGRIIKIKGVEELVYAVAEAKERGLRVKCRFVGEMGEELLSFTRAVNENVVEYREQTDDVIEHYSWCDALILPSYGEGMSNVIQEASACGRPTLASNIPGCKELIEPNITGYVFEAKDKESLLEATSLFCHTPYEIRKRMGVAARRKMENEFDRKKIVDIYLNKINSLTGGVK